MPHTLFNELEKDFKAEVLAAEMIEHGVPAERMLVLQLGALKRPFSKDVESVEEELSDYDHKEYTTVKTPREGIYDMLPEGLFHLPTAHKSAKTHKEIIKAIKQRKQEEQQARAFFMPFESAINYMRLQMALYENRLDKRSHYDELVNIFADHWEIFQYLDARQANIFLHLVPIMHDIRDDHPVIQTVIEMMLLLPVEVTMRSQLPLHPAKPVISKMGDSYLGADLTTGNRIFEEGTDELLVRIGPLDNETFKTFMPGGVQHKILQLLCDYLLPIHMDQVTEFILQPKDKITRLVDETSDFNSVLGADTYL